MLVIGAAWVVLLPVWTVTRSCQRLSVPITQTDESNVGATSWWRRQYGTVRASSRQVCVWEKVPSCFLSGSSSSSCSRSAMGDGVRTPPDDDDDDGDGSIRPGRCSDLRYSPSSQPDAEHEEEIAGI